MTLETANDIETRQRLIKENIATGLSSLTPREQLLFWDTVNDLIQKGGKNIPTAKIDLTDGISSIGGEREAYLQVRQFLTSIQHSAGIKETSEYDDLFAKKTISDEGLSSKDEHIRHSLLGYTGSEGVFQRDALMEKMQKFWQSETL